MGGLGRAPELGRLAGQGGKKAAKVQKCRKERDKSPGHNLILRQQTRKHGRLYLHRHGGGGRGRLTVLCAVCASSFLCRRPPAITCPHRWLCYVTRPPSSDNRRKSGMHCAMAGIFNYISGYYDIIMIHTCRLLIHPMDSKQKRKHFRKDPGAHARTLPHCLGFLPILPQSFGAHHQCRQIH